jgi:predicted SprT family Zn-dependent metalloprotease
MFKYENPTTSVEIVKAYNYLLERKEKLGSFKFAKQYGKIWSKIERLYKLLNQKQKINLEDDDYEYTDLSISQLLEFNNIFEYTDKKTISRILKSGKSQKQIKEDIIKLFEKIDDEFVNDLSYPNSDRYELEKKYKEFNAKYFNNSLPVNLKLVWNKRIKNKMGLAYAQQDWNGPDLKLIPTKIEMNDKVHLPVEAIDSVLVHEMIHIYNYLHNQKGHGKHFQDVAYDLHTKYPELNLINKRTGNASSFDEEYFKYQHLQKREDFKTFPALLYLYKPTYLSTPLPTKYYRFFITKDTNLKNESKVINMLIENLAKEGLTLGYGVNVYKIEINSPDFIAGIYTDFIDVYRANIGYKSFVINNIVNSEYSHIASKISEATIINMKKGKR